MNCDGVRGLLSAYLDGELSPGELLRVEQHLRRCHCCADEVDTLRQTIALVKSLDEVEVPATFRASLHDRLVALGPPMPVRTVPAARPWQRHLRTWAIPAAAAAAVLAVGMGQISQLGTVNPGVLVPRSVDLKVPSPPVKAPVENPGGGQIVSESTGKDQSAKNPEPAPSTPPKEGTTAQPGGTNTAVNPGKPAEKGRKSTVLQGYTVTLLDKLTRPENLPAKVATSYSFTLKTADTAQTVAQIKAAHPGAAEVTAAGRADIVARVDITVPVQDAEATLANIRQVLGQNAVQEPASSADLASSIALSFKRLNDLDSQRDMILTRSEEIVDEQQLLAIQKELDEIAVQAKAERELYQQMQTMVSTVTISVYLQK